MKFEERLSIEMKAADASLPGAPLSWPATIARGRRRRAVLVLAVATASASVGAALVLGGLALTGDKEPNFPPAAPSPTGPSPTPSPSVDGAGYNLEAVEPAVTKWLGAVAAGDHRAAWATLGPASRNKMGSFEAFRQLASGDYQGTWARWAGVEADLYLTPAGSSDEGSVVVVTMVGEVSQEGSPPAVDAQTLVVRVRGDNVRVEPEIGQYSVDLITPEAPQPVDPAVAVAAVPADVVFEAEVTKSVSTYFDIVDQGLGHEGKFDDRNPAGLRTSSWDPSASLPPGQHILTVYSIASGGPIDATALIFTVE
jgi:hypothetical protein